MYGPDPPGCCRRSRVLRVWSSPARARDIGVAREERDLVCSLVPELWTPAPERGHDVRVLADDHDAQRVRGGRGGEDQSDRIGRSHLHFALHYLIRRGHVVHLHDGVGCPQVVGDHDGSRRSVTDGGGVLPGRT